MFSRRYWVHVLLVFLVSLLPSAHLYQRIIPVDNITKERKTDDKLENSSIHFRHNYSGEQSIKNDENTPNPARDKTTVLPSDGQVGWVRRPIRYSFLISGREKTVPKSFPATRMPILVRFPKLHKTIVHCTLACLPPKSDKKILAVFEVGHVNATRSLFGECSAITLRPCSLGRRHAVQMDMFRFIDPKTRLSRPLALASWSIEHDYIYLHPLIMRQLQWPSLNIVCNDNHARLLCCLNAYMCEYYYGGFKKKCWECTNGNGTDYKKRGRLMSTKNWMKNMGLQPLCHMERLLFLIFMIANAVLALFIIVSLIIWYFVARHLFEKYRFLRSNYPWTSSVLCVDHSEQKEARREAAARRLHLINSEMAKRGAEQLTKKKKEKKKEQDILAQKADNIIAKKQNEDAKIWRDKTAHDEMVLFERQ